VARRRLLDGWLLNEHVGLNDGLKVLLRLAPSEALWTHPPAAAKSRGF
jgi:hypothetical protein